MTVPSPHDNNLQPQFDFEEEYNELNAQLDALSKCLDILEEKSKKLCDEANRLSIECKNQTNETSS
ncbi:hypothetical protein MN116_002429 [Schistosoma mekongi]|uniref:Uncharacterized protein n=1 Tax=Schistosoma mekongi TaxID=38744 RepID=A0AAE1ZK24_SCHME|nr:hypothetical protein MN116_002429 [Schistosoma mekongi]